MRKFYDIDHEKVLTEDELRKDYESLKATGDIDSEIYSTFEYYLESCMIHNNGSLQPVADDWKINRVRKAVAWDIVAATELKYEDVINILVDKDIFGNWSSYELDHRPVDVDSLTEIVEMELEGR